MPGQEIVALALERFCAPFQGGECINKTLYFRCLVSKRIIAIAHVGLELLALLLQVPDISLQRHGAGLLLLELRRDLIRISLRKCLVESG